MRTRPLRVAYCCADPGVPVFGSKGSSVHVQGVLGALRRAGCEVELFATRVAGDAPDALGTVRTHQLPSLPAGDARRREQAALAANAVLRVALGERAPFDVVYERYSLWSYAGMEYARDAGIPGVLEVNAPLVEEQATYRELHDRPAAEGVELRATGAAAAIVAVSRGVARRVAHDAVREKTHVIPNGIDPDRFSEIPHRDRRRPFTVGFVGTLKPWHGLETLVDGFVALRRTVPDARLLVVGDGPLRPVLEQRLAEAGVADAARLAGATMPADVPALLAEMDVGVAPYPDLPGFYFSPLKVIEYMASALPVVASRIGDVPDLVADGSQGILSVPGDAESLADALVELALDPERRLALGSAGRHKALSQHTWDHVVARVLALAGMAPAALEAA